jgi:hypothetical protein
VPHTREAARPNGAFEPDRRVEPTKDLHTDEPTALGIPRVDGPHQLRLRLGISAGVESVGRDIGKRDPLSAVAALQHPNLPHAQGAFAVEEHLDVFSSGNRRDLHRSKLHVFFDSARSGRIAAIFEEDVRVRSRRV